MTRRAAQVALLVVGAAALSGCVAAAIPLAAGAALARSRADAPPPAKVVETEETKPIVATELTELPAPTGPSLAVPADADTRMIGLFAAYTTAAVGGAANRRPRQGALLAQASDLKIDRAPCAGRPPAVFLDLDPGKETFDPLASHIPAPALASVLAKLRGGGVTIVWFSRLGDNFMAPARTALAESGLDVGKADRVVLMRDIGERKQSRRDEAARELCPIALLGDERADFDELYLYLRDPDAALALDHMIGRGWFLASPLRRARVGGA